MRLPSCGQELSCKQQGFLQTPSGIAASRVEAHAQSFAEYEQFDSEVFGYTWSGSFVIHVGELERPHLS